MENGAALRCYNAAGQLMVNTTAPITACAVINVSILCCAHTVQMVLCSKKNSVPMELIVKYFADVCIMQWYMILNLLRVVLKLIEVGWFVVF